MTNSKVSPLQVAHMHQQKQAANTGGESEETEATGGQENTDDKKQAEVKVDTTLKDNQPQPETIMQPAGDTNDGDAGAGDTPWERNNTPYDPEKAARLIANLRAENQSLRANRHSDENKALQQAQQMIEQLQERVNHQDRTRALIEAGISEDFVDLVTGNTPDEIKASVQRLIQLRAAGAGEIPEFTEPNTAQVAQTEQSRNDRWRKAFGF